MNVSFTIVPEAFAFNYGEFATIKIQARRNKVAVTPMRSLLADHHIKRLAS